MAALDRAPLRTLGLAVLLAFAPVAAVQAQVSVGIQIGLPGVQIGVNMPTYPQLVRVPGYPVYYDPQASNNYFFYDGLYWVYANDNWYASSWYNGPWEMTGRDYVPLFVLRIPVRYYRQPPVYFSGWNRDAPPRWAEHWGREWEQRRPDWDRWDHRKTPAPAPLPRYQQKYPSDRYPTAVERQREILRDNYRHVPREAVTREHLKNGAPAVPPRASPRQPPVSEAGSPGRMQPHTECKPGTPGCRIELPKDKAQGRQKQD